MRTSIPLLQGLVYRIHITPLRGKAVIGRLEEEGEFVLESEFPSHTDAYWALMEIDGNEFISRQAKPQTASNP